MSGRPMDDRLARLSDAQLEAALLDLGAALAPTPASDLSATVRARVADLGVPVPGRRSWLDRLAGRSGRPVRRGVLLGLAALLVLAGIAVAIGYGLPGLRIVILGPTTTASPSSAGTAPPNPSASVGTGSQPATPAPGTSAAPTAVPIETLGLGDPVDPAGLDAAAGHRVLLPTLPELGQQLGVFVRGDPPATLVSAAYAASSAMPAGSLAPVAAGRAVAILVMEFPGATDAGYLQKMLQPDTTIEPVTVGGHAGLWIAGRPHELLYLAPNGDLENEPARLASNVLAWNDGDLTYRIEGAPDLATAQRIAASLR